MKKFLSLALALVMTMSLVTVSAGAKDFTDDSKIVYDEAVAVISEIGVVDGYTDGAFNPQNTLTRGAAAKIICNLVLGPTTASALSADAAPFSDVPATHEFAGYIAYCSQQGIINGYADGTFKPAGTLTGYQFMKMLLGALGYDGEIEGFTGANWTVNVAKLALGVGLDDGNDDFSGNAYVTREEACLYAFNTLKADMVEYDSKTSVSIGGAEVVIAGSKAQVADQGVYENTMNEKGLQFAEKYFPKLTKTKNDTDPFGRPAAEWKYKSNVIGSYADYSDLLDEGSFTAKAKKGTLYSLVGSSVVNGLEDGDYDFTVYVDGKELDDPAIADYFVKSSSAGAGVSGNGVVTEVFMDDDNNVTIVQIKTYLVKATADYNSTKESLSIETVDVNTDDDAPVMPSLGTTIDNDDVNVESFKEDDYILVTYSYMDKAIESAVLAEVVTGEVSEYTWTDSVIIDGTTYKYNKIVGSTESSTDYTVGEDAKVVLDEYGYIIYIDEALSSNSYVYIADVGAYSTTGKTAVGNAYFTDGTYDEIVIKKVDGETGSSATQAARGWYTFSKDTSDKYTLNSVKDPLTTENGTETVTNENGDVTLTENGKVKFASSTFASIKGNSSTIFVVVDSDDDVTAYTGVANVPDISMKKAKTDVAEDNVDYVAESTAKIAVVYNDNTNYAKYVFIDLSDAPAASVDDANSAADYLFLLKYTGNKTTSGEDTYYKYKVVYDGTETEKYVESSLVKGGDSNGLLFRDVKENAKGYVTKATLFTGDAYHGDDKRDVVELGSYDPDTKEYTYASTDVITYSKGTLTIGENDYVIGDKCNVTLAFGKNANLDLVNDGDDYTLYQVSANSAAGILKGYYVYGTAYVAVDDNGSEVATDIYVWVAKAAEINPTEDDGDDVVVPTGFSEEGGKIIYTIAADATAPTTLAMRNLVVDYVAATYELDLDSFAAAETTEGSEATYTATFGGATVTVEVVKAAE